jgi:hypothetical protein
VCTIGRLEVQSPDLSAKKNIRLTIFFINCSVQISCPLPTRTPFPLSLDQSVPLKLEEDGGVVHVVQCLPRKCKTLSSNPKAAKKEEKKRKGKGNERKEGEGKEKGSEGKEKGKGKEGKLKEAFLVILVRRHPFHPIPVS